jgi:hypothetical protein
MTINTYVSVIPTVRKINQEDEELKASLGCRASSRPAKDTLVPNLKRKRNGTVTHVHNPTYLGG